MAHDIKGLIHYFKLEDWWLSEFSEVEQNRLIECYGASLIKGDIHSTSQTIYSFLKALASFWNPTKEDSILASRILVKTNQVTNF